RGDARRAAVSVNHAGGPRGNHRLEAPVDIQLPEYLLPVPLDGVLGEHQPTRNFPIGNVTGRQLQNVYFTMGELSDPQPGAVGCLLDCFDPGPLRHERFQQLRGVVSRSARATGGDRLQQMADLLTAIDEGPRETIRGSDTNRFADIVLRGAQVLPEMEQRGELETQAQTGAIAMPLHDKAIPVLEQPDRAVDVAIRARGPRPRDRKTLGSRCHALARLHGSAAAEQPHLPGQIDYSG